ncbi:glycosyl transferase family 1 protein [Dorcoceras hygrometricum]|uniref:Glycosyl transferase family 1 protein n=1 Tax=Dorcoceras hygrometricum TaxID=472368 RepID=A0A2Z7CBH6_9LAMI|nr:glycosyl transferase family 1 protein [Dorcoceras hygrometricum]
MPPRNRVAVVVLGDIGRSPRMQYHALSLARQTQGPTVPQTFPKILRPLILIFKPIIQFLVLLWYLCVKIPAPDAFIVQNPPSVPTLVVVKWASWLRRSAFIVDWHNFGYTLLSLSVGRSSYFVAVYRWIEKHFGKMAHGSLCVTRAMQHELAQNWDIKTPDEDFSILLEAAVMYDRRVAALLHENDSIGDETVWEEIHSGKRFAYPRLLFIITGKGPEKEKYEKKLKKLSLKRVAFRTMWLSAEDYALLLGSADLGVCLHTSSSGLDLPMKVSCFLNLYNL